MATEIAGGEMSAHGRPAGLDAVLASAAAQLSTPHIAAASSEAGKRSAAVPPLPSLLDRARGIDTGIERHERWAEDLTQTSQTRTWGRCHDRADTGARRSGVTS
jgi:hypothetical protein